MSEQCESLGRQIRFLTSELTKTRTQGEAAAREFETKHLKNFKRSETIRKKNVELKSQLYFVNAHLERTKTQVAMLEHSVESMNMELKTVRAKCRDMEDALSRQPIILSGLTSHPWFISTPIDHRLEGLRRFLCAICALNYRRLV